MSHLHLNDRRDSVANRTCRATKCINAAVNLNTKAALEYELKRFLLIYYLEKDVGENLSFFSDSEWQERTESQAVPGKVQAGHQGEFLH